MQDICGIRFFFFFFSFDILSEILSRYCWSNMGKDMLPKIFQFRRKCRQKKKKNHPGISIGIALVNGKKKKNLIYVALGDTFDCSYPLFGFLTRLFLHSCNRTTLIPISMNLSDVKIQSFAPYSPLLLSYNSKISTWHLQQMKNVRLELATDFFQFFFFFLS